MEVVVRAAAGIESCFASLPLAVIHALERTAASGYLPALLPLELRAASGPGRWRLAWSGAVSQSDAVEVSQQFAECISLPDNTKAWLNAVSVLPKAEFVSIEPISEDDWEILELNSELAEEAILKQVAYDFQSCSSSSKCSKVGALVRQELNHIHCSSAIGCPFSSTINNKSTSIVCQKLANLDIDAIQVQIIEEVGIVYDGMKFPLWLHGHNVVEFLVVSSSPKNSIVQLVPGTEVAVAPKKRKDKANSYQDVPKQNSVKEQFRTKALLRVQPAERKCVHKFEYNGIELGVFLTYVVQIHPDTAANLSFNNLQLVTVIPKLLPKESVQNEKEFGQKKGVSVPNKERSRHITVRILFSDSVAKGHIILPQSLRHFIRTDAHSWVYVQRHSVVANKDMPSITISPVWFKMLEKKADDNSEIDSHEEDMYWRHGNMPSGNHTWLKENMMSLLFHEFNNVIVSANDESTSKLKQEKFFIKSWLIGQLKAIASQIGETELNSVLLPSETLLHFEVIDQTRGNTVELLYLLTVAFENSDGRHNNVELVLGTENDGANNFELALGKLELAKPISLDSTMDTNLSKYFKTTLSSLSWLETAISDITKRLSVLLSSTSLKLLSSLNCPLPGHVLIYGPPGSGKTALSGAAAKYFEEHKEILAHVVYVDCSKLALEKSKKVVQAIGDHISEALVHSPSIVVFDDLDNLISFSSESQVSQPSSSNDFLVKYLTDILDEYRDRSHNLCGFGPIAFMASAKSLETLPQALTSSGRFDFHVQLSALAVPERIAILKHEVDKLDLQCSEEILSDIASKCDGYDAYDLEILVDRAVHAAAGRFLLSSSANLDSGKPVLLKEDFLKAMHDFVPIAMRDLRKVASEGNTGGWEDVGGLTETVNVIRETIELPSKYPSIFAHAPLRLRSNILLYGPPGCGKTHIVRAAAEACSLRFISIKGPELLNKYIGASEQAVRDLFAKAVAAAPCLLFFDEFESLAQQRGNQSTGVTDRVVNQFLTELDGVEALTGVFVFAATNKPELIDAALLRPGRFDRLLLCDFPRWNDRLEILKVLSRKFCRAMVPILAVCNLIAKGLNFNYNSLVHAIAALQEVMADLPTIKQATKQITELLSPHQLSNSLMEIIYSSLMETIHKLPLASDANLEEVASLTEGFSGSDLQLLLSEAELAAAREFLDSGENSVPGRTPVISKEVLMSVASKARPSISEDKKMQYNEIYSEFVTSRQSVSKQAREAKGKRATLA